MITPTKSDWTKVEPDASVCFLLGAGFSASTSFRLPTAIGLISRDWVSKERFEIERKGGIVKSGIRDVVRRCEDTALLDYITTGFGDLETANIEAVMTDLHTRTHGIGRAWEESALVADGDAEVARLERLYNSLLDYIASRLHIPAWGVPHCPSVEKFVDLLRYQDSILTLNYDTIVEMHLCENPQTFCHEWFHGMKRTISPLSTDRRGPTAQDNRAPFSLLTRVPKGWDHGLLVKLHGSTDWYACANPKCRQFGSIEIIDYWFSKRDEMMAEARCRLCGYRPRRVIVPPTASKPFSDYPTLYWMWINAYRALLEASRWVIIGVSFAPTDFHLGSLVRAALDPTRRSREGAKLQQICIVDQSHNSALDVVQRLASLMPYNIRDEIGKVMKISTFSGLDDYLSIAEQADGSRVHRLFAKRDDNST